MDLRHDRIYRLVIPNEAFLQRKMIDVFGYFYMIEIVIATKACLEELHKSPRSSALLKSLQYVRESVLTLEKSTHKSIPINLRSVAYEMGILLKTVMKSKLTESRLTFSGLFKVIFYGDVQKEIVIAIGTCLDRLHKTLVKIWWIPGSSTLSKTLQYVRESVLTPEKK
ncbi:hypothetical protein BGX26_009526 [Mortierella sp. AD094]|nr:hypothetical protein BGX26_009526 [Mortierella sp. AD094]